MGSKALPKTPGDKALALKHLDQTIAFESKKAKEHRQRPANPYNRAHASEHDKGVKASEKQKKKVLKAKVKAAKAAKG